MFGFGKKEEVKIASPLDGKIIDITAVNDPVFADKMMGDGFAVVPSDGADTIVAPCDGKIMLVPDTRHAVAIAAGDSGKLELLIHVGLDTATLGGEGFTALVSTGDSVKRGDALIKFDGALLKSKGKDATTMKLRKQGGEIDAFTSATITSKAVCRAIADAQKKLGAVSSEAQR